MGDEKMGKGTNIELMALSQSIAKDERLFRLKHAHKQGKIVTVKSIEQFLGISRATALKYVDELKLEVVDEQRGIWLNEGDKEETL